ncbi:Inositol monophosphatase [Nymphon striatum]|nr:Inositol monophosphatase [Nymphon striatum]
MPAGILRGRISSPEVWDKADNAGPVTEADIAIDSMLKSELLRERQDYGWLSEETEDGQERLGNERVFIIDPIDGTRSFIAGEKHFSHSLAISENGRITTAVVYVPMMDLLFAATEHKHSTLNGEKITTTSTSQVANAMLTLRDCWEWDIAAGDLIVRQAGGKVTDRHDSKLAFNNPHPKTKGCHAAGQLLHSALQARIRQTQPQ